MSSTDSPRESCISSGRRTIGWPPSSTTPGLEGERACACVGFSKTSATTAALERARGARRGLQLGARSSSASRSSAIELVAGEQVPRQARAVVRRAARPDLEPLPRPRRARAPRATCCAEFARDARRLGVGRRAAAGGARRGGRRRSRARAARRRARALTSRNALLPLRRAGRRAPAGPLKSNGGGSNAILVRGERDRRAPRALRLRRWPERRVVHAVRLRRRHWVAQRPRPGRTRSSARRPTSTRGRGGDAALGGGRAGASSAATSTSARPRVPGFARARRPRRRPRLRPRPAVASAPATLPSAARCPTTRRSSSTCARERLRCEACRATIAIRTSSRRCSRARPRARRLRRRRPTAGSAGTRRPRRPPSRRPTATPARAMRRGDEGFDVRAARPDGRRSAQTVTWTNDDAVAARRRRATDGATFESDDARQGGDVRATRRRRPATIDYVCTLHSGAWTARSPSRRSAAARSRAASAARARRACPRLGRTPSCTRRRRASKNARTRQSRSRGGSSSQ